MPFFNPVPRTAPTPETTMYAVIKSGGKQYQVQEGDTIRVEKLSVKEGGKVTLDEVLLVADGDKVTVGTPNVAGAKVTATVQSHGRGPKVKIVKFKRRKHYQRQTGHRQSYTELAITGIKTG
jgi:large subunit ribosomal protein L21